MLGFPIQHITIRLNSSAQLPSCLFFSKPKYKNKKGPGSSFWRALVLCKLWLNKCYAFPLPIHPLWEDSCLRSFGWQVRALSPSISAVSFSWDYYEDGLRPSSILSISCRVSGWTNGDTSWDAQLLLHGNSALHRLLGHKKWSFFLKSRADPSNLEIFLMGFIGYSENFNCGWPSWEELEESQG